MSQVLNMNASFTLLAELEKHHGIRAIDYQFADFIYQQALLAKPESTQQSELAEQLGLLACVLSIEVSKGHICLRLQDLNVAEYLSVSLLRQKAPQLHELIEAWQIKQHRFDWAGFFKEQATSLQALVTFVGLDKQINIEDETSDQYATPLTWDNGNLYLTRYWTYEHYVAQSFLQRSQPLPLEREQSERITQTLAQLFERDYIYLWQALQTGDNHNAALRQRLVCEMLDVVATEQIDWSQVDQILQSASRVSDLEQLDHHVPIAYCLNWQKVAAAVALTRNFSVISGGPGTGKTTTVVKLLAALVSQSVAQANAKSPVIKLVAPTGKAAARLTESIGGAIEALPIDPAIKALIPAQANTLHRLLGANMRTTQYRHNRLNPLHVDVLVVDEASMVDLPMMFHLLQALPKHARLILLGDKDQLSSVEAGAILGDLCQMEVGGYQTEYQQQLTQLTGFQPLPRSSKGHSISDSLCMLQKSYRFHARSGIGKLAKAMNLGEVKQVSGLWQQGYEDIGWHALDEKDASLGRQQYQSALNAVQQMMVNAYQAYCQNLTGAIGQNDLFAEPVTSEQVEQKARDVLKAFAQARLLCAVREGEFGVENMNRQIELVLAKKGNISPKEDERWYLGRPIMISQNDANLGLHNGDIGVCLLDESQQPAKLRVYFEMPDGSIKGILPSRVPKHELAFAMTIHKSQGSEFAHTVMLLPVNINPVLTRELVYTGVTRAKSRLDLFATASVLNKSIMSKTQRSSGLSDKLLPR